MDSIDTRATGPEGAVAPSGDTRTLAVAVVGGTGTLGRQVVAALRAAGHDVRALSRHSDHPVDLRTGRGLAPALAGCGDVVDAGNGTGPARKAARTLVDGTERLLDAEAAAGVRHHVSVDIVGSALVPMAYFELKTAQQHLVESGPVPWSTVSATQFHEFAVATLASYTHLGLTFAPPMRVQPVASAEVAAVVADVAQGAASGTRTVVTGPEVRELRDLARAWKRGSGRHALVTPVVLPGAAGRALRDGALTSDAADVVGRATFEEWLARTATA
jgi:uncharacterized protein YbjT (DUF2867 family)